MKNRNPVLVVLAMLAATLWFGAAITTAAGPDLVIGDLYDWDRWGQVGDIVAYSIGTDICNYGDEDGLWIADTNEHPVIAQNMYRHKDGRMEMIGISWLKHGFTSTNSDSCGLGCDHPGTGSLLGVGCSDAYSAGLNGDQDGFGVGGLGPRFEVNAATGVFSWPYFAQGQSGNAIYKRLQVHEDDLIGALNPGARYFIEGQYVTQDDAQAGNGANNVSYREVDVQSDLDLSFIGDTVLRDGAIRAWQVINPDVDLSDIDIANDGRLTVASRATDLGGGQWHYEYAVHNINSHRSAGGFEVSIPSGVSISNVGFRDVDYHSGEPYDGTDWSSTVGAADVSWATDDFGNNEDANALRWGTMYNFRFDADAPPGTATATIDLFRPGSPNSASTLVLGPADLTGDPNLNIAGTCPGAVTVAVDDLTPNGSVAMVSGSGLGTTPIPGGACAGVDLGLTDPNLLAIVNADGNGVFSTNRTIGGGLCGAYLQAVDLSTCDTSNVLQLP